MLHEFNSATGNKQYTKNFCSFSILTCFRVHEVKMHYQPLSLVKLGKSHIYRIRDCKIHKNIKKSLENIMIFVIFAKYLSI